MIHPLSALHPEVRDMIIDALGELKTNLRRIVHTKDCTGYYATCPVRCGCYRNRKANLDHKTAILWTMAERIQCMISQITPYHAQDNRTIDLALMHKQLVGLIAAESMTRSAMNLHNSTRDHIVQDILALSGRCLNRIRQIIWLSDRDHLKSVEAEVIELFVEAGEYLYRLSKINSWR